MRGAAVTEARHAQLVGVLARVLNHSAQRTRWRALANGPNQRLLHEARDRLEIVGAVVARIGLHMRIDHRHRH